MLIARHIWEAIDRDKRRQLLAEGQARHAARGLCEPCYKRAKADGTVIDHPRTLRPSVDVLEDWQHIEHDPTLSRKAQIRIAAPRLGMTVGALEMALSRAARQEASQ